MINFTKHESLIKMEVKKASAKEAALGKLDRWKKSGYGAWKSERAGHRGGLYDSLTQKISPKKKLRVRFQDRRYGRPPTVEYHVDVQDQGFWKETDVIIDGGKKKPARAVSDLEQLLRNKKRLIKLARLKKVM